PLALARTRHAVRTLGRVAVPCARHALVAGVAATMRAGAAARERARLAADAAHVTRRRAGVAQRAFERAGERERMPTLARLTLGVQPANRAVGRPVVLDHDLHPAAVAAMLDAVGPVAQHEGARLVLRVQLDDLVRRRLDDRQRAAVGAHEGPTAP